MARGSRNGTIRIYWTSDRVVNRWLRDARKVTLMVQADKKLTFFCQCHSPRDGRFFFTLIFPSLLCR